MPTIDFYFDFVSPYAFFAHHRLPQIAAKHGCDIAYRPIDLAARANALRVSSGQDGISSFESTPRQYELIGTLFTT